MTEMNSRFSQPRRNNVRLSSNKKKKIAAAKRFFVRPRARIFHPG